MTREDRDVIQAICDQSCIVFWNLPDSKEALELPNNIIVTREQAERLAIQGELRTLPIQSASERKMLGTMYIPASISGDE